MHKVFLSNLLHTYWKISSRVLFCSKVFVEWVKTVLEPGIILGGLFCTNVVNRIHTTGQSRFWCDQLLSWGNFTPQLLHCSAVHQCKFTPQLLYYSALMLPRGRVLVKPAGAILGLCKPAWCQGSAVRAAFSIF